VDDIQSGQGRVWYPDGSFYNGGLVLNQRSGRGRCNFANGNVCVHAAGSIPCRRGGFSPLTCSPSCFLTLQAHRFPPRLVCPSLHAHCHADEPVSFLVTCASTRCPCRFEGDWLEDRMHGEGTLTYAASSGRYPDGTVYSGHFVCGECSGRGELTFPDGSKYQGAFAGDARCGRGVMVWPSGDEYNGLWEDDKRTWRYWVGRRVYPNGDVAEGEFEVGDRVRTILCDCVPPHACCPRFSPFPVAPAYSR
jgi:hypothetical protein